MLFRRRLKNKEFLTMLRNLSVTLKAGLPLVRALTLLESDGHPRTRRIFNHLRRSVETGMTLADAMESAPYIFPPLSVNLVRAGELSGTLQRNMAEIVIHLQKSQELARKIKAAMLYPTFVLVALFGLGLSVGTFVLPQLIPLFDSLDVQLPISTQVILLMAKFFNAYGLIFTPALVVMIAAFIFLIRTERMKPIMHRIYLHIPLIRSIQKNAAVAQITRTLSTLLKSGIPIVDAVDATAKATGNYVYRDVMLSIKPRIQEGTSLGQALRSSHKLFPEITITLIDVGEATGTLSDTLAFIADYYEDEVDYAVKNLTTALEPLLLIFIGIIVGTFVLSIITPIYDVTSSVQ